MTNKQAYEALSAAGVHWGRKDKKHIVVWTSGYKDANCDKIEQFLLKARMLNVEQEFDKVCGKTRTVYSHKLI